MRVPFLRSSPAARSTSKTAKRRIFLAGLLDGIDTAAGSLASANFLTSRTVWGRVGACPERSRRDPYVRAKLDDDLAFWQIEGISAEALPQATWGQRPSAVRRSNAPLIWVAHKEPVELRSTWTAEAGCPHVACDGSPHERGARAHINLAELQYFCVCR